MKKRHPKSIELNMNWIKCPGDIDWTLKLFKGSKVTFNNIKVVF